jgi:hypothetical protein
MKTTTQTQVTHYEVQKKRREALLEEWRGYHKTVMHRADVETMDVPSRRMRGGVYAGRDGDRPTAGDRQQARHLPDTPRPSRAASREAGGTPGSALSTGWRRCCR